MGALLSRGAGMSFRECGVLLLLLAACATPEPKRYDQVAIPVGPLVAPRPLVLPAPVALPPTVPVVDQRFQIVITGC